jgi:hypothetical protein
MIAPSFAVPVSAGVRDPTQQSQPTCISKHSSSNKSSRTANNHRSPLYQPIADGPLQPGFAILDRGHEQRGGGLCDVTSHTPNAQPLYSFASWWCFPSRFLERILP